MRIFLTGATGFIGANIMAALLETGHELVLLVRAPHRLIGNERIRRRLKFLGCDSEFKDQCQIVLGDITEPNLGITEDIGRIDEVWHAAGCISFNAAQRLRTQEINFGGTKNALAFCEHIGARRFFYISTAYVCGKRKGEILEDEPSYIGQDFNNSYEFTKFLAEEAVRQWTVQSGTPAVIFRPSIVAGHSVHGRTLHFFGYYRYMRGIYVAALAAKRRQSKRNSSIHLPIRLLGKAEVLVNIAPVDYSVDLMIEIAKAQRSKDIRGLMTYHIVNPNPASFRWWTETSAKALDIIGLEVGPDGITLYDLLDQSRSNQQERLDGLEYDVNFGALAYLPYISEQRRFDQTNVQTVLGTVPALTVDESMVERWMWLAQSLGFQDKRLRLDAAMPKEKTSQEQPQKAAEELAVAGV